MNRLRSLSFLVAGALWATVACGGELLTADGAVRIALQKNPQVVNAGASVLDARSGVYSSLSSITPHLSAGLWQSSYEKLPDSRTNSSLRELSLSASWNAVSLSSLAGVSAARQTSRATGLTQAATRNEVAYAVRRQFYTVVQAVHQARVNAEALRLARDNERRVHALFEVGSVSKSDVLKSQVQTAQSQLDSLTAVNQIAVQRIALASTIGVPEEAMGEVDTTLTLTAAEFDETALVAEASRNRPDLRAAEASLGAARASQWSARLLRVPTLQATASKYFRGKGHLSFDTLGVSRSLDFGTEPETRATLALNWNLFDGFSTEARNGQAKAQLVRQRETLDGLKRNLAGEVHLALLSYREALEATDVANRAVDSATENLKLTQQKYNVGSATILDLIDAQVQLQRAENQQVAARAGVRVAEAGIRRATGRND